MFVLQPGSTVFHFSSEIHVSTVRSKYSDAAPEFLSPWENMKRRCATVDDTLSWRTHTHMQSMIAGQDLVVRHPRRSPIQQKRLQATRSYPADANGTRGYSRRPLCGSRTAPPSIPPPSRSTILAAATDHACRRVNSRRRDRSSHDHYKSRFPHGRSRGRCSLARTEGGLII